MQKLWNLSRGLMSNSSKLRDLYEHEECIYKHISPLTDYATAWDGKV